jgi:V/A-type H+-transporting ATPase subunit E
MSAEKILERIKKDSEQEIRTLLKEAQKQSDDIIKAIKKDAKEESDTILKRGKQQAENIKKILISKASQDAKREIMKARENIIEDCFTKAHHSLSNLKGNAYKKIVTTLIKEGRKKLEGHGTLLVSREYDKDIAKTLNMPVSGSTTASGGIILKSEDGRVTLDYTFEGILKRKKDEIRIEVGKFLFTS